MNYKISAYSTALFSSWINVEELNLLIDAGDGLTAGLMQKSRKIKYVFITHADRDHLNGLPQFIQLNSRPDFPELYYPKNSGSFPAMQQFLSKFDPHVTGSKWKGIEDGQIIAIKKGFEIQAVRNEHIQVPIGVHKSFSYKLYETKKKLKPEFKNYTQEQIKNVAIEKGRDFLSETTRKNIISFSGDTPVDDYSKWDNCELLIHEATFLRPEADTKIEFKRNKHSTLAEVLKMVKEININQLILNHFSSRYSKEEVTQAVQKQLKALSIKIPVFVVYPGEIKRDILRTTPING